MKKTLTLLGLLTLTANAQTGTNEVIDNLSIDGAKQSATVKIKHDFGFPTGVKSASYTFQCPKGVLDIVSYEESDGLDSSRMFSDEPPKIDEAVTKLFKSANLINSKPPYALFRLKNATYKVVCKNGFLVSDFSEFAKKNLSNSATGNNVSLSNDMMYFGRVTLAVPVLGSEITLVTPEDFKSLDQTKAFALGTAGFMGPNMTARDAGSGLFYYNASNNSLIPLQYDGKMGKSENTNNIVVPANKMMVFYYTEDYKKDSGWYKVVLDLKNFQNWTEPSVKPKGAKITS